jgi:hypothetical protein
MTYRDPMMTYREPMELALARRVEQEELVHGWLRLQKKPCRVRTIARLAGMSVDETRAALYRLSHQTPQRAWVWKGCWSSRAGDRRIAQD